MVNNMDRKELSGFGKSSKSKAFWYLYKFLDDSFPLQKYQNASDGKRKSLYVLNSSLNTLQLLTLLWFFDTEIKEWEFFYVFWSTLEKTRLDCILHELKALRVSAIVISSLVLCLLFASVYYVLSISSMRDLPRHLKNLLRVFLRIISSFLWVPLSVLLSAVIKSTFRKDEPLRAYQNLSPSELDFGYFGLIALLPLFMVLGTFLLHKALCFEIRHFYANKNLSSRGLNSIPFKKALFEVAIVVLHSSFGAQHEVAFRFFVLVGYLVIYYNYYKYKPYFNYFANSAEAAQVLVIICFAGALQVGYFGEGALLAFSVTLLGTPIVLYMHFHYFKENINQEDNFENFEKTIRELMESGDPKSVIDKFSYAIENSKESTKKLLVVWETNYCIDYVKDERLARIKLSKCKSIPFDFKADFQVFRCNKRLEDHGFQYHEDVSFLRYKLSLDELKEKDEELCLLLVDFWSELCQYGTRKKNLEQMLDKTFLMIKDIKKGYESLVSKYSNCCEALDLYGTFLIEVLSEHSKGRSILQLKEKLILQNESLGKNDMSFFDSSNGIIMADGDPENIGIITYVNAKASELFLLTIDTILGSSISDIVPFPFNINHDKALKNYLEYCRNPEIELPEILFLKHPLGYLVECNLKVTCTCIGDEVLFLILVRAIESNRQLAFIDMSGIVLGYSKLLPTHLRIKSENIVNQHIDNLIPGLNFEKLVPMQPVSSKIGGHKVLLVLIKKKIKAKKFFSLLFIVDEEEIETWEKSHKKEMRHIESSCTPSFQELDASKLPVLVPEVSKEFTKKMTISRNTFAGISKGELGEINSTNNQLKSQNTGITYESSSEVLKTQQLNSKLYIEKYLKLMKYSSLLSILLILAGTFLLVYNSNQEIKSISFLDNVNYTGKLLNNFDSIVDSTRKLSVPAYDHTSEIAKFKERVSELKGLYQNILDLEGDICLKKDSLHKANIPVAYSFGEVENENLVDLVSKVIQNCEEIIGNYESGKDYNESQKFLIVNLIGNTRRYLKFTMDSIKDCKLTNLKTQQTEFYPLLIAQLSIITASFLVILYLVLKVDKHFKQIWDELVNQKQTKFVEMIHSLYNRLNNLHESGMSKSIIRNKERENFSFSEKSKFLKIVIVMYGFCFCFNIVTNIVIEKFSMEELAKNSELFNLNLKNRYESKELNFWMRETVLSGTELNMTHFLVNYTVSAPFQAEFEKTLSRLQAVRKDLSNGGVNRNTYPSIYKTLFEEHQSEFDVFVYGIQKGLISLLSDSREIVSSKKTDELRAFDSYIYALDSYIEGILETLYKQSNSIIEYYLRVYIYVSIAFGVLNLCSWGWFVGFLRQERALMKKIKKVHKIIAYQVHKSRAR